MRGDREMKTLIGEPSEMVLTHIYKGRQTRPIRIGTRRGTLAGSGGGWGYPAIEVNFPRCTAIIAREREAEDYEQRWSDAPERLEVYKWQYEGEEIYYHTLAAALARINGNPRAL